MRNPTIVGIAKHGGDRDHGDQITADVGARIVKSLLPRSDRVMPYLRPNPNRGIARNMSDRVGIKTVPAAPVSPRGLSPRLRETLNLVLEGLSKREIAERMSLSPNTVHGYIRELYKIYNVTTRARLMAKWVKRD
jgi:DNA-binding CsgD family transcriptional regulator